MTTLGPPTGGVFWSELALIDHHCHSVRRLPVDESVLTSVVLESPHSMPAAVSAFDTMLGAAIRRWCGPRLDLPANVSAESYLQRRAELSVDEVNRIFLGGARLDTMLVDTGHQADTLIDLDELASPSGASVLEVVRLEAVAEDVADTGTTPGRFAEAFERALADRVSNAAAIKSILAYRYGFQIDFRRPSPAHVRNAVSEWFSSGDRRRLTDPVILRHLLWAGLDTGLPLQLHTGFGDPDLDLASVDPSLLTPLLRMTADLDVPMVLLHTYPFHRRAGYLARVWPHVYVDVGLTIPHVGSRSGAILAEMLELTPFAKLLYSSDGFALPELHFLAAFLFRDGVAGVLRDTVDGPDRARVAEMIGAGNARRLYRLPALA